MTKGDAIGSSMTPWNVMQNVRLSPLPIVGSKLTRKPQMVPPAVVIGTGKETQSPTTPEPHKGKAEPPSLTTNAGI
jgi:hypothetical protein